VRPPTSPATCPPTSPRLSPATRQAISRPRNQARSRRASLATLLRLQPCCPPLKPSSPLWSQLMLHLSSLRRSPRCHPQSSPRTSLAIAPRTLPRTSPRLSPPRSLRRRPRSARASLRARILRSTPPRFRHTSLRTSPLVRPCLTFGKGAPLPELNIITWY
jgi:hypothetical protein